MILDSTDRMSVLRTQSTQRWGPLVALFVVALVTSSSAVRAAPAPVRVAPPRAKPPRAKPPRVAPPRAKARSLTVDAVRYCDAKRFRTLVSRLIGREVKPADLDYHRKLLFPGYPSCSAPAETWKAFAPKLRVITLPKAAPIRRPPPKAASKKPKKQLQKKLEKKAKKKPKKKPWWTLKLAATGSYERDVYETWTAGGRLALGFRLHPQVFLRIRASTEHERYRDYGVGAPWFNYREKVDQRVTLSYFPLKWLELVTFQAYQRRGERGIHHRISGVAGAQFHLYRWKRRLKLSASAGLGVYYYMFEWTKGGPDETDLDVVGIATVAARLKLGKRVTFRATFAAVVNLEEEDPEITAQTTDGWDYYLITSGRLSILLAKTKIKGRVVRFTLGVGLRYLYINQPLGFGLSLDKYSQHVLTTAGSLGLSL